MTFSDRMGIESPQQPITVRNDAPYGLRLYLLQSMLRYEGLKKIRSLVCYVTRQPEDPSNWGENDFMKSEIQIILESCPWNRIYDVIEAFATQHKHIYDDFEKDINDYFLENGIGWKLSKGVIVMRGDDSFEDKIAEAIDILGEIKIETSISEIKEAITDLSKRPTPDITGSIQHSLASLECLSREITGCKNDTLGKLIKSNPDIVPKPLDSVISQLYGFASEHGRHLREGEAPDFDEAELTVHICASLCVYMAKKNFPTDKL